MNYQRRLLDAIPGGAHTYSRGHDQFPVNAPPILKGGKGVEVFDPEGNRFLDYGMALRAVTIGYAEDAIDEAAIAQIRLGNNLTRPSLIELEAAEAFLEAVPNADMVKFAKNGSSAVSAAVKLARAYTGRELAVRCQEHPFFSYDDWFIGSTVLTRGIPESVQAGTTTFHYNDLASLERLFDRYPGQIACVVMEAATTEPPAEGFLPGVQALCRRHGAVFILDEMITGFRWHLQGAQHYYGLEPDLSTFGKAMANGFSVACVAGKRDIMELGGIDKTGTERVFLMSSTHGAEMSSLGAFVAALDFMRRERVVEHLWTYGQSLMDLMARVARDAGVADSFKVGGYACSPYFMTLGADGKPDPALRTLFLQEMIRHGVMMPWIALAYRHDEQSLDRTRTALEASLPVYAAALREGVDKYLQGPAVKPVFRKYN
ncbi:glutamate-1-semialdehyde 2,1-aminomutase [Fluviicoccus keumensis]|uniref:Glutamate-1-semialdehyde 2,1-aminomutase n=1 Tax=Fluviicoccus keumensis TaxID=1435465 RepID=A0A4Q7Z9P3_9GAMM|nr:glutamate-1-semialdehyde 2,1-aminomutase [Fluviicoccus keumensis]RZU47272.1 glutamate-1-semialdehyde 2,1-aminomutase [Fluviicoccus keumensis]